MQMMISYAEYFYDAEEDGKGCKLFDVPHPLVIMLVMPETTPGCQCLCIGNKTLRRRTKPLINMG